jgi:hypothetical protein
MPRTLAPALSMLLLLSLPILSRAEELTPDEQAFFAQHTADMVRFEPQKVDDMAVEKVFSVPIYTVKLIIGFADGNPTTTLTVARIGDKLVGVNRPSSDGDLPDFQKMISPEFKLKTNTDAKMMQQALNVLYPAMMESEKKLISFRRAGNSWIFVRGEFFESKSGFIMQVGADGGIISVAYQLRLP